ncbi:MAG: hypothetical protein H0W75_10740 [Chitinophagaceae bacterium]|nr:hypothetical protein [Chitinophagaceae bacterium]
MGAKVKSAEDLWSIWSDKLSQANEQQFEMMTEDEYQRIKKLHGIN